MSGTHRYSRESDQRDLLRFVCHNEEHALTKIRLPDKVFKFPNKSLSRNSQPAFGHS
jgi:hypothetical protein